uniref:Uncharacterized protein n=1 Tax=Eutreptiella gymnastica TaxID=73025 RepID=A0A7S4FQC3_9EUGL
MCHACVHCVPTYVPMHVSVCSPGSNTLYAAGQFLVGTNNRHGCPGHCACTMASYMPCIRNILVVGHHRQIFRPQQIKPKPKQKAVVVGGGGLQGPAPHGIHTDTCLKLHPITAGTLGLSVLAFLSQFDEASVRAHATGKHPLCSQ